MSKKRGGGAVALLLAACLLAVPAAARKRQVVILHTNDTHSCVMPLPQALTDTMLAGRGGFLRRCALVREQRALHPDLLLFDSGDFSQGSNYYTLFAGDVEVGLMNEMGYDAVTIGNHEFDNGIDNMARLFRQCHFPVVCSNYDFTGTELQGLVKPYVTLKRQGVKIGVFALAPKLEGLVQQANYQPVKYLPPAEVAQRMVDVLRQKEKCDFVICLSHLGWEYTNDLDSVVVQNTEGIDLILGGHSHTYMEHLEYAGDKRGRPVPVNQNGRYGAFVGKLVLSFRKGHSK